MHIRVRVNPAVYFSIDVLGPDGGAVNCPGVLSYLWLLAFCPLIWFNSTAVRTC